MPGVWESYSLKFTDKENGELFQKRFLVFSGLRRYSRAALAPRATGLPAYCRPGGILTVHRTAFYNELTKI